MADIKGTTLVFLRKEIRKRGDQVYADFVAKLPADLATLFDSLLPTGWIDIEKYAAIAVQGVDVVFPGDPDGMYKLGKILAKDHLSGVYKIFLRVVSVPYLLEQAAKIWRTYHSVGDARVEKTSSPNHVVFVVENFPGIPRPFLASTSGYIAGSTEMTSAKNVKVALDETNPKAWRWKISWE